MSHTSKVRILILLFLSTGHAFAANTAYIGRGQNNSLVFVDNNGKSHSMSFGPGGWVRINGQIQGNAQATAVLANFYEEVKKNSPEAWTRIQGILNQSAEGRAFLERTKQYMPPQNPPPPKAAAVHAEPAKPERPVAEQRPLTEYELAEKRIQKATDGLPVPPSEGQDANTTCVMRCYRADGSHYESKISLTTAHRNMGGVPERSEYRTFIDFEDRIGLDDQGNPTWTEREPETVRLGYMKTSLKEWREEKFQVGSDKSKSSADRQIVSVRYDKDGLPLVKFAFGKLKDGTSGSSYCVPVPGQQPQRTVTPAWQPQQPPVSHPKPLLAQQLEGAFARLPNMEQYDPQQEMTFHCSGNNDRADKFTHTIQLIRSAKDGNLRLTPARVGSALSFENGPTGMIIKENGAPLGTLQEESSPAVGQPSQIVFTMGEGKFVQTCRSKVAVPASTILAGSSN